MTNTIAIFLGLLVVAGIAADIYYTDAATLLFLATKFTDFTDWIAFWR